MSLINSPLDKYRQNIKIYRLSTTILPFPALVKAGCPKSRSMPAVVPEEVLRLKGGFDFILRAAVARPRSRKRSPLVPGSPRHNGSGARA